MLCHSVGGFSCWFSSFQPRLIQVHPHTVAKKIFQKWKHNHISPLLKPVHQPPGQGQACVLCAQGTTPAPSLPVLLGLSPLLPSLLPQSQDLCTYCPPSLNTCPTPPTLPLVLEGNCWKTISRTKWNKAMCVLASWSCRHKVLPNTLGD